MKAGFRRRAVRWLIALLLLPVNVGVSWALWDVARAAGGAMRFCVPVLAGAGAWLVVFSRMPRPTRVYVFGHELTHALCAWCFGIRVSGFRVGRTGGEVRLSRSNAFIALAPYFLPLYALLWSLAWTLAAWWTGPEPWMGPVHHVGLGAAYAFHVTMTFVVLRIRQPDLVGEGLLFSASVIWLGNALIPLLALPVLAGAPGMATALRLALIRCAAVLEWCLGAVR